MSEQASAYLDGFASQARMIDVKRNPVSTIAWARYFQGRYEDSYKHAYEIPNRSRYRGQRDACFAAFGICSGWSPHEESCVTCREAQAALKKADGGK